MEYCGAIYDGEIHRAPKIANLGHSKFSSSLHGQLCSDKGLGKPEWYIINIRKNVRHARPPLPPTAHKLQTRPSVPTARPLEPRAPQSRWPVGAARHSQLQVWQEKMHWRQANDS